MATNDKMTKLVQALCYLAYKQPKKVLGFTKAYKLLWLADRLHLRQYGRTITVDRYFALPHGIVPTEAKDILDGKEDKALVKEDVNEYIKVFDDRHQFKAIKEPDVNAFSDSDQEVLDEIIDKFGAMNGRELSELSHKFPEWKAYEKNLTDSSKKSSYSVNMDFFFLSCPKECADVFDEDPETLELSKDFYHLSNPVK